jgi:hypothetical protein
LLDKLLFLFCLGIYGTQGVPSTTNTPGCRRLSISWKDANGNFWLFGGEGYDSNLNLGMLRLNKRKRERERAHKGKKNL